MYCASACNSTLVVFKPMTLVWNEIISGLRWENRTHNSSVTAPPVELSSPWEQGGGELGICIQVLSRNTCILSQDYAGDTAMGIC